ncbi:tyrosine-type recombinase/integrase [Streptomyces sp. NPDC088554]|uniref:tyrosine-type recombinase/integrase n=1 Tax=Streptomyces sp. NPDC088554 TaxID=3365865 RepID=UPI0038269A6F
MKVSHLHSNHCASRRTHDLRHSAAARMVRDPHLTLTDVQWVLGHTHLTTTEIYLDPRELHQAGEKSQVASSQQGPDRLRDYYDLAA